MARKPEPEKPPNHERWLVSFADFMTLMFALFVVLFANSQSDELVDVAELGKGIQAAFSDFGLFPTSAGSTSLAIGGSGDIIDTRTVIVMPGTPSDDPEGGKSGVSSALPDIPYPPPDLTAAQDAEGTSRPVALSKEGLKELFGELGDILKDELDDSSIVMHLDKRGIVISLGEAGFFPSGSATLKLGSFRVIDDIAVKLQGLKGKGISIRIEGHTDSVPLKPRPRGRFQSNRELSMFRASRVLERFEKRHGFSPQSLVASGYGAGRPIASNATREGRARNRRVDIVVLSNEFSWLEPAIRSFR